MRTSPPPEEALGRIPAWLLEDLPPPRPRRRRAPLLWAAAGCALLVALTAAVVGSLGSRPARVHDAAEHRPTPTVSASTPPAEPVRPLPRFSGRPSQVSGRIVDEEAGLSYARFGWPWHPGLDRRSLTEPLDLDRRQAEFRVVMDTGEPIGDWAEYVSARLPRSLADSYNGPDDAREAARGLAKRVFEDIYPRRAKITEIASQPVKNGWLVGYRVKGVDRISPEIITVAVVDTGRPRPATLVAAVPTARADLLADLPVLIRSVKVLD